MAKNRIRYGKGKQSIEIDSTLRDMLEEALRDVAPLTMAILEAELDERVKFAKENWIVRAKDSKRSVDRFTQGIRIVDGGRAVEAFFRNNAPYAYAIKAASYSRRKDGSESTIAKGKRIATVAMWEPAKQGVDKLVKKLADAYIKEQKKVK